MRRLNDPYPLPISWRTADPSLTDSWDSLVKLAIDGAGWPAPPPWGTWATGPDGLSGKNDELVEMLARVPTGRLVVLGEPGSGKTMMMVRLVLDLLARRGSGGPVPFLASVASWDPTAQDLRSWLGSQLMIDHPALAGPLQEGIIQPTRAAALLTSGLILPILDGLDEISERVRGPAISRINDALRPGERIVVTCRSDEYREAVRPEAGVEVTLRAAAAVQLRPLEADDIRRYLSDDAAGPVAKARWGPVFAELGTEAPAGQALSTPLMVGLARSIYNPRPGELAGILPDPKELCSPALSDCSAVEALLFNAFVPAAYRHSPVNRWNTQSVQKWLTFLALHLERRITSPDLALWQLRLAFPRLTFAFWLVIETLSGAATGFAAAIRGHTSMATTVFYVIVGAAIGAFIATVILIRQPLRPARGLRWRLPGMRVLLIAVAAGSIIWISDQFSPYYYQASGLAIWVGLTTFLGTWLITQEGAPLDIRSASSPRTVLARDRTVAIITGVGGGFGLWVTFIFTAAVASLIAPNSIQSYAATTGIVVGFWPSVGVGIALALRTSWPYYALARLWLVLHRQLPLRLIDFLADAHRRGVLRQVGAVYQFRHIELQHLLANREKMEHAEPI